MNSEPPKANIDQSVTSHNQSGGITARTVIINPTQIIGGRAQFTEEVARQMLQTIPKGVVRVTGVGNQQDWNIAAEAANFLKRNGYNVQEPNGRAGQLVPYPSNPFLAVLLPDGSTNLIVAPATPR